ncbi:MAG: glutamine synthetase type III, partial [Clostridia bacterium]|nr:glutamine synthetase type III [Clostridia bacterium]
GNGYDDAWIAEAEKRGLLNLPTTPDCIPYFTRPENVKLFTRYQVYTAAEMVSRQKILLENYCNLLRIEALTMLEMARQDILPAVIAYGSKLCETAAQKQAIGMTAQTETALAGRINVLTDDLYNTTEQLEACLADSERESDFVSRSCFYRDRLIPTMEHMRACADQLETLTAKNLWPYPGYMDMLLSV